MKAVVPVRKERETAPLKGVRRKERLFGALTLASGEPLHTQIAAQIRELILSGALDPGTRLPGRRTLASDLRVSGNTVLSALQQLVSEGLLETRAGSGTYVAACVYERSVRRTLVEADRRDREILPLDIGTPALDLFPRKVWSVLQARRWQRLSTLALGEGHPGGWAGLREQIAQHVGSFRGLKCNPEQVIVTPGAQAALALIGRALAKEGESIWIEDPGYQRSVQTLLHVGLRPTPIRVDAEGFDVAGARAQCPARLAMVTPARQFPTGVVMSDRRRKALLQWAHREAGWIVEDDFESDFCFDGRAPRTLASDAPEKVIYISSFSPVLFPALRMAFVIAPHSIVDRLLAVRAASDRMVNTPLQMVLHDFMADGHLSAHIRRCTAVYGERRSTLVEGFNESGFGTLFTPPVGLHAIAWLDDCSDASLAEAALEKNVVVGPMSRQAETTPARSGLVLGFAAHTPNQIRRAVRALSSVHDDLVKGAP